MTGKKHSSRFAGMKALFGNETDALKTLMKEVLQEILSLVTQIGKLELRIPRDRNGEFSTALFERYQRSEKALVAALAEMDVPGVSTRNVTAITEELSRTRI